MRAKFYYDLAQWLAMTGVAVGGALVTADYTSVHGRVAAAVAALAVVAAGLKSPPSFVQDVLPVAPPAQPPAA
jgi:hypothetical protein